MQLLHDNIEASGCLSEYSGCLLVLQSIWAISIQLRYAALELTNSSSIRITETSIDPGLYYDLIYFVVRYVYRACLSEHGVYTPSSVVIMYTFLT